MPIMTSIPCQCGSRYTHISDPGYLSCIDCGTQRPATHTTWTRHEPRKGGGLLSETESSRSSLSSPSQRQQ